MGQRVAREHARNRHADLGEDMAGHQFVVAGQHLHGDARRLHGLDRCPGACFRRIEENGEAGEDKIAFVGDRGGCVARIDHTGCDAQGAETLRTEAVEGRLEGATRLGVERLLRSVRVFVSPGQPQQILRRALDDQTALALVLDQHRDTPPLEIERHFVDLLPARHVERMGGQNRLVERALHAAFELAVDIGIGDRRARLSAPRPSIARTSLMRGFGQRAGLVGAQHVHGAEIVDGRKALHDHLSLGQLHRRPGKRDRHDHRQQLRRQPDGERQREHQRFQHRPMEGNVHDQDKQHHQHGEAHDQHAETANADRKSGGRRLFRQARREMAERRLAAGPADENRRRAADHRGAGKDGVRRSGGVFGARRGVAGLLLCRVRLAREERLVDEQIAAFEQPRIGGNEIAGDQFDNVAGDQLVDRNREVLPSRRTVAWTATDRRSASTAFWARTSWTKSSVMLSVTMVDDDDEARDVAGRRG